MKDDLKFMLATALTLILALATVYAGHRHRPSAGGGERIDVPRFERLMDQGLLSDHPADYAEELP